MKRFTKQTRALLIVGLVFALLLAACSTGDDAGESTAQVAPDRSPGTAPASGDVGSGVGGEDVVDAESLDEALAVEVTTGEEPQRIESEDSGGETDSAETVVVDFQPQDFGRDIIKTGTMTIEVDDVMSASSQASTVISALGGVVFGQETTTQGRPRTVFTFKVLPEDFDKARGALADIGDVTDQTVTVDDVTERVVDLESRIATAEASVLRLRALLAQATDLDSIAQLESQLLERETNLETLRGQLRTVKGQVALATLIVTVLEAIEPEPMPAIEVATSAFVGHDGDVCPGETELDFTGDTELTLCVEVTNTGDSELTEVVVQTTGLDLEHEDFEVVSGSLESLEPESSVVLAARIEATETQAITTSAVATPVGDEDAEPVGARSFLEVRIDRPSTLPGFGDSLSRGWDAVETIFGIAVLVIGLLLPFSWILLVIAALWWYRRRHGVTDPAAG